MRLSLEDYQKFKAILSHSEILSQENKRVNKKTLKENVSTINQILKGSLNNRLGNTNIQHHTQSSNILYSEFCLL